VRRAAILEHVLKAGAERPGLGCRRDQAQSEDTPEVDPENRTTRLAPAPSTCGTGPPQQGTMDTQKDARGRSTASPVVLIRALLAQVVAPVIFPTSREKRSPVGRIYLTAPVIRYSTCGRSL
jgi:hypothetical protein